MDTKDTTFMEFSDIPEVTLSTKDKDKKTHHVGNVGLKNSSKSKERRFNVLKNSWNNRNSNGKKLRLPQLLRLLKKPSKRR